MIIMGTDPGLARLGYGVLRKSRKGLKCLAYGVIKTESSLLTEQRLKKIYRELNKLLRKYKPKILAVENVFFFKNLKTALPVSEVKGVILLAAAQKGVRVEELTPLQVKMAICGYGRGTKEQIQRMVKKLLNLKELPKSDDAADALAVALCLGRKRL